MNSTHQASAHSIQTLCSDSSANCHGRSSLGDAKRELTGDNPVTNKPLSICEIGEELASRQAPHRTSASPIDLSAADFLFSTDATAYAISVPIDGQAGAQDGTSGVRLAPGTTKPKRCCSAAAVVVGACARDENVGALCGGEYWRYSNRPGATIGLV